MQQSIKLFFSVRNLEIRVREGQEQDRVSFGSAMGWKRGTVIMTDSGMAANREGFVGARDRPFLEFWK